MKRSKKLAENLNTRLADYGRMMNERSLHGGQQQRKETGGYHRPGSNK